MPGLCHPQDSFAEGEIAPCSVSLLLQGAWRRREQDPGWEDSCEGALTLFQCFVSLSHTKTGLINIYKSIQHLLLLTEVLVGRSLWRSLIPD